MITSETEFLDVLHDALIEADLQDLRIQTFADAGLLTDNKGLVVRLPDENGKLREYQITVVQSR